MDLLEQMELKFFETFFLLFTFYFLKKKLILLFLEKINFLEKSFNKNSFDNTFVKSVFLPMLLNFLVRKFYQRTFLILLFFKKVKKHQMNCSEGFTNGNGGGVESSL